jgi:hypothetical protein
MTARTTLADIGTAAGTLVLAASTFVAVRAAARSTRIAERALLAGQRPVLVPSESGDETQSVQFAGGEAFPVGGGHALVHNGARVIYLAIPLANVGTGLAVLRGYRLTSETAADVEHDPRGVAQHRRGDPSPLPGTFSPPAAGPADQLQPGWFLAGRPPRPADPPCTSRLRWQSKPADASRSTCCTETTRAGSRRSPGLSCCRRRLLAVRRHPLLQPARQQRAARLRVHLT